MATPTIVFGGGIFTAPYVDSAEEVQGYLDVLQELDIKIIDTGAVYGDSEKFLGERGAASKFTIDTKHAGMMHPEPSAKDVVVASGKESLKKLGTSQVRFHSPSKQPKFWLHSSRYHSDLLSTGRCLLPS